MPAQRLVLGYAWCEFRAILDDNYAISNYPSQGGGSTFGVLSSVTVKAFPSPQIANVIVILRAIASVDTFWSAMAYFVSQYPALSEQGIAGYSSLSGSSVMRTYTGSFLLPILSPSNTTASLAAALRTITDKITSTYRFQFFPPSITTTLYPNFQAWFAVSEGPKSAGTDFIIGSRLLPAEVLTRDLAKLKTALMGAASNVAGGVQVYLLGGKGVRDAIPRGGSDAVNPAWRTSLLHVGTFNSVLLHIELSVILRGIKVTGVGWPPLDADTMATQEALVTHTYVKALRVLAPNSGAYCNEVCSDSSNT